ncbi:HSP20-like chaperone [Irpex rosettiformis]|uniref:HSP20-like chaperone n=1 Tax=Irpex rosettiformis TaxID=378272 RepID=A0ACB8U1N0_9APHY|nr:HSP20-like chaperone [Irpex rosettiformis]
MSRPSPSPRKFHISREADPQNIERARARALRMLVHGICQRIQANSTQPQTGPHRYLPRMDLYDDEQSPIIHAMLELPGVSRDNISVKVQGGLLVVDGRRGSPLADRINARGKTPANGSDIPLTAFKIKELKYGDFYREISLPESCTTEDINAEMTDGMLLLSWPRTPHTPRTHSKVTYASPSLSTTTNAPDTNPLAGTHLSAGM